MQLRSISRIIMEQIGSAVTPQVIRHDLVLNYQFKPLCKVSSVTKGTIEVYWDAAHAAQLKLDTDAVKLGLAAFQASKQTNWTAQL